MQFPPFHCFLLCYYSSSVYVYILSGFNWKIGLWAQWWLPGDCDGPVCPASPLWCLVYQRGHLCKFFKASLLKDVHSKYTFTDLHAWGHTQSFLFWILFLYNWQGPGTDESVLIEIFGTRTPKQIQEIRAVYGDGMFVFTWNPAILIRKIKLLNSVNWCRCKK